MSAFSASWLNFRAAGVLAHVTSLPGDYGIGHLGAAKRFVEDLASAGVRYWQLCPLGPTGFGDSPYQTFSSRAGNPYLIDLGSLLRQGLLRAEELAPLRALPRQRVDYGELYRTFWPVLSAAAIRFFAEGRTHLAEATVSWPEFTEAHRSWLPAYAQFMALKDRHGGRPWPEWPAEHRDASPDLAARLDDGLRAAAAQYSFYQYVFFAQWAELRRHAAGLGVGIIGDVPIFVALDSADTWSYRQAFQLDGHGHPTVVAGVPPDYFSHLGQLWGNPLYDWYHLRSTGYAWWIERLRAAFDLYDLVRLDHFRAFASYWEIPAGAPDARRGRWRKGPGRDFFAAVAQHLPHARLIAEDLGYIGPEVVDLREFAGLPGMRILQFAYGHDANNVNLPHFYPRNSVTYTGTHDNLPTRAWLTQASEAQRDRLAAYFGFSGPPSAWPFIRAALASTSRLAVIPLADLLDLGDEATFNRPGTSDGNWQWRVTEVQLDDLRREALPRLRAGIDLFDRQGHAPLKDFSEPPH